MDTSTPTLPHTTTTILHTKPRNRKWNPQDYVYTYGLQVKGNPILGAGDVNPRTNTTSHINIKSQLERHAINRSELMAITVALKQENIKDNSHILTNSSFCINAIRDYTMDPSAYKQHLQKDLLHITGQLLRGRDVKQIRTHIEKVKSHTDIEYNETSDTAARRVEDGEATPGIVVDDADHLIGDLRTWPQIRNTLTNTLDNIHKFNNLKDNIKKELKTTTRTFQPKDSSGGVYKRRGTRVQPLVYKYYHKPRLNAKGTPTK
jgi:ribonuclease HI